MLSSAATFDGEPGGREGAAPPLEVLAPFGGAPALPVAIAPAPLDEQPQHDAPPDAAPELIGGSTLAGLCGAIDIGGVAGAIGAICICGPIRGACCV